MHGSQLGAAVSVGYLAEKSEVGNAGAGRRLDRVLGLLLECDLRQILEAGVFQADPRPGNLRVTPSDKLVLLDFGCTKPMPERTRRIYFGDVDRSGATGAQRPLSAFL
jgi:hypothetical protein